ncbi:alpha/beta hydrolase [Gordonia sp. TBRC 11910]|uniref:Alpha/beta hydrolase n=1 Tax=Gordonia asplenii TaxID=2725283 RepID=A0A848KXV3_9ACTN|nr:alpha/beta hydrolase [Gordonia asplenii]NMO02947.1 alpha/beta hydrolase [Gordonia asplenii]
MTVGERLGAGRYLAAASIPDDTVTTTHEITTRDGATVSGILRVRPGAVVVCVLMHPRQDFSHHVLVPELLEQGYAVWTQSTRTGLNDMTLLHEQALLDVAAGHAFLWDMGFEDVVSVGHSGGGALAAYYIEQASLAPAERFATTPGGKAVPLRDADMPVPSGLMLMAPHPGQGVLLGRMIDPSVANELDPMSAVPGLDMYNPDNGFRAAPEPSSYSPEFVADYRAAQRRRVERIDAVAREAIADANAARRRFKESGAARDRRMSLASGVITVHRTDADLRSVDLSLDPNDRPYGSLFGYRPDLTNYGVVGFGRVTTPEAWLSTWSSISSRASLLRCAPAISIPCLLVELTGDQACFPADAQQMVEAFGSDRVTHVRVPGKHFGGALVEGEPTGATLAGLEMGKWLGELG